MFELRTEVRARPEQTATVNCQLIVRSELLALPHHELLQRLQQEVEENPALELELTPLEVEVPVRVVDAYRPAPTDLGGPGDVTFRAPAQYTLRDELHRLAACSLPPRRRRLVDYLIEAVDDRGYLRLTCLDAALALGVSEDEVERAVADLQSIAPPRGRGARPE